jgi:flagellar hook-associated protein 3 FlgL
MNISNSSHSILFRTQRMVGELQKELRTRQSELSTGRKSELTIQIGSLLSQSMSMRAQTASLQAYLSNNQVYLVRLENTQSILSNISSNAQEFKSTLLQSVNDISDRSIIVNQARNFINLLIYSLNTSINNRYIFSGENSNIQPVNTYFSKTQSLAKLYVDTIFASDPPDGFGMPQSSSLISSISTSQISNFVSGPLADLFSETGWSLNWSNASKEPIKNQISANYNIDMSVTSSDPALRKLAMAYVMIGDLGADKMNDASFKLLVKNAVDILDDGLNLIIATQARVGLMQQTISRQNDLMESQKELLNNRISSLENADQNEVALHINSLLTLIQSSYSLTARVAKLSLTNYL